MAWPKEHGGRGFSALAVSAVLGKLASRSVGLSTLIVIPNSIGPAKLLVEYGTPEQQQQYLPRLARGEEIPCFALTEPEAGSDAASIGSTGEVFRDRDGALKIRLDWDKRFITLAPIATLLGLAVQLADPENLLGAGVAPGITCVLVPAGLPGVRIGRRHDPMGASFPNGPTSGTGVVVPAGAIIGGPAGAGQGWRMLMETLSGGRAVSLPAQSIFGMKYAARMVGAYSVLRRQFGMPIGRFEGIVEPVARIAGLTYMAEAARVMTCGAVDLGEQPAVVSAIVKLQSTELARRVVTDGMDVVGGSGICRGPRNVLAGSYASAPVGITVEGANILTRTLIVFGQGAVRAHPFARREVAALMEGRFASFLGWAVLHVASFAFNVLRLAALELTRGCLAASPVDGAAAPHHRRLAWAAARFAVASDVAMFGLGSQLKRRGLLTGRLADMLSWLFLGFAALRRFEAEGRREEDRPLLDWSIAHSMHQVQVALEGFLANLRLPVVGRLAGMLAGVFARVNPLSTGAADELSGTVARTIQVPGEQRDRITADVFLPADPMQAQGRMERAFRLVCEAAPLADRVFIAVRRGALAKGRLAALIPRAAAAGILLPAEARQLAAAEEARLDALAVDSFELSELVGPAGARPEAELPAALPPPEVIAATWPEALA
jgi:acyl-CoA dehydrogenase